MTGGKGVAVAALDHEQHHGALARLDHGGEFPQVLQRTRGHAIRKFGERARAPQVAVLHFQPAPRAVRGFQQEIHAGVYPVTHLAPVGRVTGELRDRVGCECLGDQSVGVHGVDPHQPAVGFYQFQGVGQLAFGIVGAGNPGRQPRRVQAQHRAWVGAVGGDLAPIVQYDVCEEAFVAADQNAAFEG